MTPAPPIHRAMLSAHAIEVPQPDITRARVGNTGVEYVHRLESSVAGPVVMLCALTHGNEYSGAQALLNLLDAGIQPRCGSWILSFMNVEAFATFDVDQPDAARFVDMDMNRVWMKEKIAGTSSQREVQRARALLPFVREADFLLDLHSMHEVCEPLVLSGMTEKALAFAKQVGFPRVIIRDVGHADGQRLIDFEGFGQEQSPKLALLVESGQHWSTCAATASMHALYRFLIATGTLAQDAVPLAYQQPLSQIDVTIGERCVAMSDDIRFTQDWKGMEVIEKAGTVIAYDGEQTVSTPFDQCVLVMPSLRQVRPGVTYLRFGRLAS